MPKKIQHPPQTTEEILITLANKVLSNFKAIETQLQDFDKRLKETEKKVKHISDSWLIT